VKVREEVEERKEAPEVKEHEANIAAFFDLDGTLVALPSLERRFFRILRYRKAISERNYFLWLREAMRLMPRGISAILQANKMYLRGVQTSDECGGEGLAFFAQAIERVAWHAKQGHEIVLMSGTLEPLARGAVRAMEAGLAARGITVTIRVFATRLEEMDGKWTGRVLGEAMFGESKARTAERLAEEMHLDLRRCYAYGDSLNDRWLLSAVGRPAAVNPSKDLAGIARMHEWPVLDWEEKECLTQRGKGHRELTARKEQPGAVA
jgi:HAD superfamily hydrolase (TIGR01490 family)